MKSIRSNKKLIGEVALGEQSHVGEENQSIEYWAMNRAHQIVIHQGMSLVEAARSLDHKRTNASTYALRQAIMDCLLEAVTQRPDSTAAAAE